MAGEKRKWTSQLGETLENIRAIPVAKAQNSPRGIENQIST